MTSRTALHSCSCAGLKAAFFMEKMLYKQGLRKKKKKRKKKNKKRRKE